MLLKPGFTLQRSLKFAPVNLNLLCQPCNSAKGQNEGMEIYEQSGFFPVIMTLQTSMAPQF